VQDYHSDYRSCAIAGTDFRAYLVQDCHSDYRSSAIAGTDFRAYLVHDAVAGTDCRAYTNSSAYRTAIAGADWRTRRTAIAGTGCSTWRRATAGIRHCRSGATIAGTYCSAWRTAIRHRRTDGSVASHVPNDTNCPVGSRRSACQCRCHYYNRRHSRHHHRSDALADPYTSG
jgi:hypothetical protein